MSEASSTSLEERWIPVIPSQYQIYNSYAVDPAWQIKFTIIWTSVLAFTTVASIPYVNRSYRSGRLYSGLAITEQFEPSAALRKPIRKSLAPREKDDALARLGRRVWAIWQSFTLWTLPMPNIRFWKSQVGDCCRRAYFTLGVGQTFLVLAYMGAVVACFVAGAQLTLNANRPGFIALAQLPLIILLSLKSPLPIPIYLPTLSYTSYNFLHRWTGRTLFLTVTVHGAMWLNQFITTDQMDQVWAEKTKRGMIAYGLMGGVVLTSLKPVRRYCYQVFWVAHVALFVGFFAAVSYHTPYSRPWIYPCLAIYGYDLVVRMIRYRIKDATLVPVDETMTMIHIPDCDQGWLPTQHVLLRVLRGPGIFESHPFTITNAPSTSPSSPRGIILYAKNTGDWTKRLHDLARDIGPLQVGDVDNEERQAFLEKSEKVGLDHPGRKVLVTIDGPYGGLKMDLGRFGSVLMVAGGSGITFVLGAIEEAIRIKASGAGPGRVDVVWVVRDLSTIHALSPTLSHLHARATTLSIELVYNLYLTNPPNPLPTIPANLPQSTTLSPYRPKVSQLLRETLSSSHTLESESAVKGLAVIACGPEGIVMEARNAVAGLGIEERVKIGGIDFHGECYAL